MTAISCDHQLSHATEIIRNGGVIAYPTEGVWGLGCDPNNETAVYKLLDLKCRSVQKGLILIGSTADQFAPFIAGLDQSDASSFRMERQRPTTWLVPDNGEAPRWIVGEHSTIALRITEHPLASKLCEYFGGPIVSTSANPQNYPPAQTRETIDTYFSGKLSFVVSGAIGSARGASEIIDLMTGEVIRSG